MSQKRMFQCQCGCGKYVSSSQLTSVVIEQALDATLRSVKQTKVIVARHCKDAYETELGLMKLNQNLVQRWAPSGRHGPLETFRRWRKRVGAAVEVMKNTHAIYERTKGFEWAKRHAKQSAILFGAPEFMQGFLARRFYARTVRRKAKENAVSPPVSEIQEA